MRVCPHCRAVYATRTSFCGLDGSRLVETETDPLEGTSVGRYQIERRLGSGACGAVYLSRHRELGTEFAIKVLNGHLGADESMVSRFKREAQVASAIRSAHVVSVIDFCRTEEGLAYIVMEFARGRPLSAVVKQDGPLSPARVARIARDVARGLASAHAMSFVHRDIKPSNIILTEDGGREVSKVLDFGIARIQQADAAVTQLTGAGEILGTPSYMAPEQWRGSQVGPPADLYALGVVMHETLTGKKPFPGTTVSALVHAHLETPPPPLPSSGKLGLLVAQLMAKQPELRPGPAEALATHLELLIAEGLPGDEAILRSSSQLSLPTPEAQLETGTATSPSYAMASSSASLTGTSIQSSPKTFFVAALIGALVIIGGAWLFFGQPSGEVSAVSAEVPKGPSRSEAADAVDRALAQRGLRRLDLPRLPDVERIVMSLETAPPMEVAAALQQARTRIREAEITDRILQAKLDALDPRVAQVATKAGDVVENDIEKVYLELYQEKNQARTPEARAALAKRIFDFEERLRDFLGAQAP